MTTTELKAMIDQAVFEALGDGLKQAFEMCTDHYEDGLTRHIEPLHSQIAIIQNKPSKAVIVTDDAIEP